MTTVFTHPFEFSRTFVHGGNGFKDMIGSGLKPSQYFLGLITTLKRDLIFSGVYWSAFLKCREYGLWASRSEDELNAAYDR